MSYQSLSLPVVAVLFISELVNAEKKELKEKKDKKGNNKKRKIIFSCYLSRSYIAGRKYVLVNGPGVGFVSFTENLQVA